MNYLWTFYGKNTIQKVVTKELREQTNTQVDDMDFYFSILRYTYEEKDSDNKSDSSDISLTSLHINTTPMTKEEIEKNWSTEYLKENKYMKQLFENRPKLCKAVCNYFKTHKNSVNGMYFHYTKNDSSILKIYSFYENKK